MSAGGDASRVHCLKLNDTVALLVARTIVVVVRPASASDTCPERRRLAMTYTRGAALALLVAGASALPLHDASARCWHNGWGWHCGPGLLALPFVAAGAVVAGAAAIATAPVRAIFGPPYYAPPPAYYGPPGYYAPPSYYPPPGYYYGPPR